MSLYMGDSAIKWNSVSLTLKNISYLPRLFGTIHWVVGALLLGDVRSLGLTLKKSFWVQEYLNNNLSR